MKFTEKQQSLIDKTIEETKKIIEKQILDCFEIEILKMWNGGLNKEGKYEWVVVYKQNKPLGPEKIIENFEGIYLAGKVPISKEILDNLVIEK